MRVRLYGRYSTELQSETSLEDQERVNRNFVKSLGWDCSITVEGDKAKSGASRHNRPGFLKMVADMEAGLIDRIVVENLSRLTRDSEDCAFLMKRATFHAVRIYCANEGGVPLTKLTAGFNALMAEQAREQGAEMVKRGMTGIIISGRSAGGRSYGYRSLPRLPSDKGKGGEIEIVPEEAAIVREIFMRYASGDSPKAIAADLNARRVPSPRANARGGNSGLWSDSTINGNKDRGTGILHNSLYIGRRKWNRVAMPKNPDSAKRVSRANPEGDWITSTPIETLRIVDEALFETVQARKTQRSYSQRHRRLTRPQRIFSGLMRCGTCGHTVQSAGTDKTGKVRLKCSGSTSRGVCPSPVNSYAEDVEGFVLGTLRERLSSPQLVQAYIDEYMAERRRLAQEAVSEHDAIAKRLERIERDMARLLKAYMTETIELEQFNVENAPLRTEKAKLKAKLEAVANPASAVSYHPAAVASFKRAIDHLAGELSADGSDPSVKLIRSVVDRIIVTPAAKTASSPGVRRPVTVEIIGSLDVLLTSVAGLVPTALTVSEGSGSGRGT